MWGGLETEEGSPATDFFGAVVERLNKEIFYRKEIQKVKGVWRFGRNSKVQDWERVKWKKGQKF